MQYRGNRPYLSVTHIYIFKKGQITTPLILITYFNRAIVLKEVEGQNLGIFMYFIKQLSTFYVYSRRLKSKLIV